MQFPSQIVVFWLCTVSSLANELYLKQWNEMRKVYADRANLANMCELTWDEKLAERAEKSNCKELKHGSDFRFFIQDDEKDLKGGLKTYDAFRRRPDDVEKEKEMMLEFENLLNALPTENSTSRFEAINPAQSRIGCAGNKCTDGRKLMKSGKFRGLCLIGPLGISDKSNFETGEPGSACEHGASENGLCNGAAVSTTEPTFPSPGLFSFETLIKSFFICAAVYFA